MACAVRQYRKGIATNVHRLAADFKVPYTTLRDRVSRPAELDNVVPKRGRPPAIPAAAEQKLADATLQMADSGFGISPTQLQRNARRISRELKARGRVAVACNGSRGWQRRFMRRFPTLSVRAAVNTTTARLNGMNKGFITKWYRLLGRLLRKFKANEVFNMDDTGFPAHNFRRKVRGSW